MNQFSVKERPQRFNFGKSNSKQEHFYDPNEKKMISEKEYMVLNRKYVQEREEKKKERIRIVKKRYNKKNPFQRKVSSIKSNAKSRGIIWSLSHQQAFEIIQKPCMYCRTTIRKIGIDRVINSDGYIPFNCVPCCNRCNRKKTNNRKKDLLRFLYAIEQVEQNTKGAMDLADVKPLKKHLEESDDEEVEVIEVPGDSDDEEEEEEEDVYEKIFLKSSQIEEIEDSE